MMRAPTALLRPLLAACFALLVVTPAHAQHDDRAIVGDLKELRIAFDMTAGEGRVLLGHLNVVDETRRALLAQGLRPKIVLAFRAGATRLVQSDAALVGEADRAYLPQIAERLAALRKAEGVEGLQQCAVAAGLQGTRVERVLPSVDVVGNAWVTLAAYQARGYAYIRP